MRKIKFRGKAKANGHWVFGNLVGRGGNSYTILNSKSEPWVDPDTIGQFTGLKDRNGKEIYEGDTIVAGRLRNFVCEVIWNHKVTAFCIRFPFESESGCCTLGEWCNDGDVEIIGNIHDNPELMKVYKL